MPSPQQLFLILSLNELIINSVKYAFNSASEKPTIKIKLERKNSRYLLSYCDNGIGMDGSKNAESFGMELIEIILDQIDGNLQQIKSNEWSTYLQIEFADKM